MINKSIETICLEEQERLLDKYFGNLVEEAAIERPESVGVYTQELPAQIEAQYRTFLEARWKEFAPETLRDKQLILEEQTLRRLMTERLHQDVNAAYSDATTVTLWERITKSNHEDVTYYKGLLYTYTRVLLDVMRLDFLEEISGNHIRNKVFYIRPEVVMH